MKKSELVTRWLLVLIVIAALVAIFLQIINEKTGLIETTYEIITFSVALLAVILAVLQGLDNARTSRELHKVAREMKQSIDEIHHIDSDSDQILHTVEEIDRENNELRAELVEGERRQEDRN